MDKVNVSYRVDERLTIRGGYNREKKLVVLVVHLNFYNFVLQRLCSVLLLFLFSFSIIFMSFSLTVLWIMESSLDEVVFHTVTRSIVHKRSVNKKLK